MKKRRIFYHFWRNADQKKIRIGYLSPYFCFHGMMQLGIVFLSNYDKERFEVFVYMYGKAFGKCGRQSNSNPGTQTSSHTDGRDWVL